jgi:hypothetical protein
MLVIPLVSGMSSPSYFSVPVFLKGRINTFFFPSYILGCGPYGKRQIIKRKPNLLVYLITNI